LIKISNKIFDSDDNDRSWQVGLKVDGFYLKQECSVSETNDTEIKQIFLGCFFYSKNASGKAYQRLDVATCVSVILVYEYLVKQMKSS
jgi:hypothetical protein